MIQPTTYETELARLILGSGGANLLKTDGYKFAMAQAGFPLRRETFYMSFRLPGAYYLPFDVEAVINNLISTDDWQVKEEMFINRQGYNATPGMKAAVKMVRDKGIEIQAAPKGSWFREKESIFAITGPSFIDSVLESLSLMLHYPIQVATEALNGQKEFVCTCEDEAEITRLTLKQVGKMEDSVVIVDTDRYRADVSRRAQSLIDSLKDKNPKRLFEVGMRACSCMQMHEIALRECKALGITSTSNVYLAAKLGMKAVGTTGHEHIMRWGNDLDACRAMRDMRPEKPSCLPDTYDAMSLGLPAAFQVMRETPDRQMFIRFDSGDQDAQLKLCVEQTADLNNVSYIFEDSINNVKIAHFEALCDEYKIPLNRRWFGAGGFFVKSESTYLTRDRVSAVYKLSMTGTTPVMKTCISAPGKASVPGVPVTFHRVGPCSSYSRLIGQAGEIPPEGYALLEAHWKPDMAFDVGFSPETEKLRQECFQKIEEMT